MHRIAPQGDCTPCIKRTRYYSTVTAGTVDSNEHATGCRGMTRNMPWVCHSLPSHAVGLQAWHTVEVAMARAMVLP